MRDLGIINKESWRFPRFFSNIIDKDSREIQLDIDESKHLKNSLRMRVGDFAIVCDMNKNDYLCKLINIDENCTFEIIEKRLNQAEPNVKIRLFQAMPKGDKMEFIIQKAVELGACEIIPVMTSRCISRPDKKSMQKKLIRYNRISYEAAKQCGRGIIPKVHDLVEYKNAISMIKDESMGIIFYECGGEKLNNFKFSSEYINVFIGSEGGFSKSEIDFAIENGWKTATLGNRILRCETAPVAALAILMNLTEN